MNFITKYYEFINLYNLLLQTLKSKDDMFNINFYYLNKEFNINIISKTLNETIFNYHFKVSQDEFNYLISVIGNEFIQNHKINLPFFDNINNQDAKIYYQSFKENIIDFADALNYDIAKVHILRNSKFELRIYYFKGLNNECLKMQDKALRKIKKKNN